MIKLGVIFGGNSVEHEISIITAVQAMNNMDTDKYDIIPIYITKDRKWYTGKMLLDMESYKDMDLIKNYCKQVCLVNINGNFCLQNTKGLFRKIVDTIDSAFPIVHGKGVEDGSLEGYLETVGVPTVGPKILGAALGQDKVVMKQVLRDAGINIVDYTWFYDNEYLEDKERILKNIDKLGYPVVVKPATLGSSVGITFVKDKKHIEEAIDEAISYDSKIVIEKAVENLVEVNSSVIGNYEHQKVSPLEEVMGEDEILSFTDKYLSNGKTKGTASKGMASTSRIIPARISKELTNNIQETSKEVFRLFNFSGVVRIDYLIDSKTNKYYVNEPNTIPGSLSFYLWKEAGVSYKEELDEIISIAIKEYKNKEKKTTSFDSNILEGFNGSKGTKGLKK